MCAVQAHACGVCAWCVRACARAWCQVLHICKRARAVDGSSVPHSTSDLLLLRAVSAQFRYQLGHEGDRVEWGDLEEFCEGKTTRIGHNRLLDKKI